MLEIIVLYVCGKKIAAMCRAKERAAWPWILLMIGSWYGGAIIGAVISVIANPQAQDPNPILLFGGLLVGAVLGLLFTFFIVNLLPDNSRYDYDDDEDDYDDRPRRRSRRDEEEEERPRKRRYGGRAEYDDEDDYDSRRSRRYDER